MLSAALTGAIVLGWSVGGAFLAVRQTGMVLHITVATAAILSNG